MTAQFNLSQNLVIISASIEIYTISDHAGFGMLAKLWRSLWSGAMGAFVVVT